jgi:hypothetical protein
MPLVIADVKKKRQWHLKHLGNFKLIGYEFERRRHDPHYGSDIKTGSGMVLGKTA